MTWRTACMACTAAPTHPVCVEGPFQVIPQQLHTLPVMHRKECEVCNTLLNVCNHTATAAALSDKVSDHSFSRLSSFLTQSEGSDMQQ